MYIEANQSVVVNLEDLVPKGHFLRKLKDLCPWEEWARPFEKCFKGEKEYGPKGYPVSILLKMMVMSYLYDMGDLQTENFVRESIPARYFVGLNLLQNVPDETTLCRFRRRIILKSKAVTLEWLFNQVIQQAGKLKIELGKVQVLDSVHTNSKINKAKEDSQNRKLEDKGGKPKPPKDGGASWGCKGKEKTRDPQTGEIREHKKWFFGYKSHVSLNQKTHLVTSVITTSGRESDTNFSCPLLEEDRVKGLKITVATGDRGYDDTNLFYYCNKREILPAVHLMKFRTQQKSERNSQYWKDLSNQPLYKKALKIRYKVEQKFGEAKRLHGLGRCRYTGLLKYKFQSLFTFLSINLKRIIKEVKLKSQPRQSTQLCWAV